MAKPTVKTCSTCGRQRAIENFTSDKRTKDGYAGICNECRFTSLERAPTVEEVVQALSDEAITRRTRALEVLDQLETVTIPSVPILAAGGPYFGVGSPPEGDFFTREYLEGIVDATNLLADEIRAPVKLGHSDEQQLAANSGLTIGEMPALGWLDNFRMEDIGGTAKIVCDLVDVPKKLAALMQAHAYRTRSVELSRVVKQDGSNLVFDGVITGLALLGAQAPAVRTLDDIVALFAAGDLKWAPDEGLEGLREELMDALNPQPAGYADGEYFEPRWWVIDVASDGKTALVQDYRSMDGGAFVVALTRDDTGQLSVPPVEEWTPVESGWVESKMTSANARVEIRVGGTLVNGAAFTDVLRAHIAKATRKDGGAGADTSGVAGETKNESPELTDDQIAALAQTFSIDGDGDELKTKVIEHLASFSQAETPEGGEGNGGEGDGNGTETPAATPAIPAGMKLVPEAEFEAVRQNAALAADLRAERDKERRDAILTRALSEGRFDPANVEFWRTQLSQNEDATKAIIFEQLEPRPEFRVVFGSDDDGMTPETREQADEALYQQYRKLTGMDKAKRQVAA